MLRQPMQRFTQMQASDIDIYRNEIRKTKNEIVSNECCFLALLLHPFLMLQLSFGAFAQLVTLIPTGALDLSFLWRSCCF